MKPWSSGYDLRLPREGPGFESRRLYVPFCLAGCGPPHAPPRFLLALTPLDQGQRRRRGAQAGRLGGAAPRRRPLSLPRPCFCSTLFLTAARWASRPLLLLLLLLLRRRRSWRSAACAVSASPASHTHPPQARPHATLMQLNCILALAVGAAAAMPPCAPAAALPPSAHAAEMEGAGWRARHGAWAVKRT